MESQTHKIRTLWLIGTLHAFTHVYQVALIPLYLKVQAGFQLASPAAATLLVTLMNVAYFLPAYPMGILADRFNRKTLLGCGLLLNAVGFAGLAFAPNYATAVACVLVAGLGGSVFHPAGTGLVAGLFPENSGRALGLVGIGASVGFFFGPIYAGWRADQCNDWRTPVLELGLLGVVMAGLFFRLAENDDRRTPASANVGSLVGKLFPSSALWLLFIVAAFAFCARDFTGSSMTTLSSLFLLKAHNFSAKETGLALSCIFIASAISNPLFGHLSDRGRSRWAAFVLLLAASMVALFPHVPTSAIIPVLMIYGFFFMASYPIVEAALMESVPAAVRGRVFGLWITIGGLVGNLAHWLNGRWVEALGAKAADVESYYGIYAGLAGLIVISLVGLPCLKAIRQREQLVETTSITPSPLNAPQSALE